MNAVGLTGGHVMIGSPQLYEVCREMDARGWMTVRCIVPLHQEPDIADDEIAARLPLVGERGQMWRGGTAKFFIDGVVETGTAWLYEPDTNGGGTVPFWPTEERYASVVARFARAGFACTTHAVGDRAVRAALDAYRAAGPRVRAHAPHRAHRDAAGPRPAAVRRGGRVRLDAAAPPGEQLRPTSPIRGAGRSAPSAAAARSGRATSGTPARSSASARTGRWRGSIRARGMGWCRLRREPGHPERGSYGPDQALTGLETLLGYTRNPAAPGRRGHR